MRLQTNTCILGREGGGCRHGNYLCIMIHLGTHTDHACQALWFLAMGKQVVGESLGFFRILGWISCYLLISMSMDSCLTTSGKVSGYYLLKYFLSSNALPILFSRTIIRFMLDLLTVFSIWVNIFSILHLLVSLVLPFRWFFSVLLAY